MCLDECQVDWDSLIAPPCQNSKCQSRHIITKGAGWVVWVDWLQGKLRKLNLALACCSSHPQVWEKLFLNIFALWSLFYSSCRFLLSSASLSEESLCRVCGKKKIISLCVNWMCIFSIVRDNKMARLIVSIWLHWMRCVLFSEQHLQKDFGGCVAQSCMTCGNTLRLSYQDLGQEKLALLCCPVPLTRWEW